MKSWAQGLASVAILLVTSGVVGVYNHTVLGESANQTATKTTTTTSEKKEEPKKLSKKEQLNQALPKNAKPSDWDLLLTNYDHPLSNQYKPELAYIGSQRLDKRVLPHYKEMAAAAKKAGYPLTIVSSYRSVDYQEKIYKEQIQTYLNQGKSKKEAEKETADYMTKPGTSEHHTGLSLDVLGTSYYEKGGTLDESFAEDKSAQWLEKHCAEYGFIVRYPKNKVDITKIHYEPWHLRYVGKENAEYIMSHHLSLEEYIDELKEAGR